MKVISSRCHNIVSNAPARDGEAGPWALAPDGGAASEAPPNPLAPATPPIEQGLEQQSVASYFRILTAVAIAAYLAFAAWSAYSVFGQGSAVSYAEDGAIETAQAAVVAASGLLFLAASSAAAAGKRWILLGCAALCGSFVLRETELRLDLHVLIGFFRPSDYREPIIAVAFGLLAAYGVLRFRQCKRQALGFLKSRGGLLLILGGVLLGAGSAAEQLRSLALHEYFEELLELAGYFVILLAALASIRTQEAGSSNAARSA